MAHTHTDLVRVCGHAACVVCGMLIVRSVPWHAHTHTHRPYARLEPKVFIMIIYY